MTPDELAEACAQAIERDVGLVLVSSTGKQPLQKYRGELLCVNSAGESVYRFTPKQCARLLRALRPTP